MTPNTTRRAYASAKGRAIKAALARCPVAEGTRTAAAWAAIDVAYAIHCRGRAAVEHWADPRLVRLALQLAAAEAGFRCAAEY